MTAPDYFALLDEPRRPWLEPNELKQKFLTLSTRLHPDKIEADGESARSAASTQFAELNAAFNCLSRPKSRLLHLLELETGAKPGDVQSIPNSLAGLFGEVAAACREADHFLGEKNAAASPLVQVEFFERAPERIEKLNVLQKRLGGLSDQLLAALQTVDSRWTAGDAKTRSTLLAELEKLYRLFSYFDRWTAQIQERVTRLVI